MALMYFCELADGFVKHIHEQSDPPAENRDRVVQGCVGSNDIVKAYEVPADQAEKELSVLVSLGITDQGTAAHLLNNFNTRHGQDLIKNAVPIEGDIQNG